MTRAAVNPFKWVYNSARWKKLRMQRLCMEPLCRICSAAGIVRPAKHVDHITPLSKGGDAFDLENTQSLCVPHHSLKTQADEGHAPHWGCAPDGTPLDPAHHWQ